MLQQYHKNENPPPGVGVSSGLTGPERVRFNCAKARRESGLTPAKFARKIRSQCEDHWYKTNWLAADQVLFESGKDLYLEYHDLNFFRVFAQVCGVKLSELFEGV